jgi:Cu+-exporting ATPase
MTAVQIVVTVIGGAKATMRNIRQNLAFAFGYNAPGIPIAAGILSPLIGWRLNPMIAADPAAFTTSPSAISESAPTGPAKVG